ncbi:RNA polymerase subunit sigma [Bordetella holmesii]|uniref:sigma-70 family RNA polymerase sigma factor n=1 Tax=Bordetella holmesii TaxID=35814 RepID=UPI0002BB10DF|nr:sigma-70 family RNA polymerase sigma factor [Bordetella holmesii]AHV92314.1 putative RNA polymerase sigma factor fecI [Bordetella holmesii ATCC 51541]AMD50344.1 RNA polymerase sigma factor [Bordetella holmesii F627]AUL20200.1 RNA polymerase subunit sigma [Bordetella holmesii]AUL23525.1 RNA polymerase subunit sigma [Bordetella holmesii]AUL26850.1 RNA polymerase subunit sigma [Bordetella holmesii]
MLSPSTLLSDQQLLVRIHTEDRAWLLGRLYTRLRNIEDAEDIAGDTFVQLIQTPRLASVREPRALIITIAKRLVWKLWRRRELEAAWLESLFAQGEALAPSPQEQLSALQTLQQVDQILDGLSFKARAAFLYSQLDGLTHKEIAASLGVSVSMVRQYIAQALARCYALAEST